MSVAEKRGADRFQLFVWIPPTRFELVSPDPKSCMIDRYTTGVDNVLDEYTSQISLQKICSIPFDAEDIKINIRSKVSDCLTKQFREAGGRRRAGTR
jgi:hypothetical protein